MRDHLKILGWLFLATGGLGLLFAALLGTVFGAAMVADGEVSNLIVLGAAVFVAALSLPALLCGWGLLNYKPWARTLGIVLSVVKLINIPVGTAIGGYGLWVLLNDETKRMLEAGDPRYRLFDEPTATPRLAGTEWPR